MLPPLNALRAFEAAARHLSFKEAAMELCVTQGAVSRHVQRLEAFLGIRLFLRQHRQVVLTRAGTAYAREAHEALQHIARATADITASTNDAVLRIKLPPTCAVRWLMPRLDRFHEIHPDIAVQIITSHGDVDFAQETIDAAIQYGCASEADVIVEHLIREELVPVCSSRLAMRGRGITAPADLRRQVLLKSALRGEDWPRWFETAGLPRDFETEGEIVLENASLTYEAAAKGLGVALAQLAFVQDELEVGTLVVPIDRHLANPTGYFLLIPRERARARKTQLFRDWILREAANASLAMPLPS
jgi:LysR family transcriptional regulator, glycine cleavage system transcriptional activator